MIDSIYCVFIASYFLPLPTCLTCILHKYSIIYYYTYYRIRWIYYIYYITLLQFIIIITLYCTLAIIYGLILGLVKLRPSRMPSTEATPTSLYK